MASLKAKKTPDFEPLPEAVLTNLRAADLGADTPVSSPALRLQEQLRAALLEDEPVVERYPLIWSVMGVTAFCSAFWALVVFLVL